MMHNFLKSYISYSILQYKAHTFSTEKSEKQIWVNVATFSSSAAYRQISALINLLTGLLT